MYEKIVLWSHDDTVPAPYDDEYLEATVSADNPIISELLLRGYKLKSDECGRPTVGAIELDRAMYNTVV